MPLYVPVPTNKKDLQNQKDLSDVTDEEFRAFFEPKRPHGWVRIYRVFCFIFFLGPLRILIWAASLAVFHIFMNISAHFESKFSSRTAYEKWLQRITYPLVRICLLAIGIVHIDAQGELHPQTRTIACNHLTPFDPICVFHGFPCAYLAMASLQKLAFFRSVARAYNVIFVDRAKAGGVSQQIIAEQENDKNPPLCVFPEGKITNGDCIIGFRTGSFISKRPVQGMTLRYKHWLMPKEMATVSWNEERPWMYLFQLFSIPFLTLEMRVLPPIDFPDSATPAERAKAVQLQMANSLGCLAVRRTNKELFQK